MILESVSPTVFDPLIRDQRRSGSRSYQTLVEVSIFALGPGRDLPMSPPQHCVVGVRLDPDAEDSPTSVRFFSE